MKMCVSVPASASHAFSWDLFFCLLVSFNCDLFISALSYLVIILEIPVCFLKRQKGRGSQWEEEEA